MMRWGGGRERRMHARPMVCNCSVCRADRIAWGIVEGAGYVLILLSLFIGLPILLYLLAG